MVGTKVKIDLISPSSIILYVPEKAKSKIIGRKGKKIERLEKIYGLRIKVKSFEDIADGNIIDFEIEEEKDQILIYFNPELAKKRVMIYIDDQPIASLMVDKKGRISISKNSKLGKDIIDALNKNKEIKISIL